MQRPHASDDVRERALAAVDRGHGVADVAAFLQNDPSTISRWRRQRAATGSGRARPRSGRPRLIAPTAEAAVRAQVAADPDATLAEHRDRWNVEQPVPVSASTLRRAFCRLNITLKKRP
jgi:transposase